MRPPLSYRLFAFLLDHWLSLLFWWAGSIGFLGLFIREPGAVRLAMAPVVVAVCLAFAVLAAGLFAALIGRLLR